GGAGCYIYFHFCLYHTKWKIDLYHCIAFLLDRRFLFMKYFETFMPFLRINQSAGCCVII
ncbi:hypothetical protein, partial [Serratia marcescens]|uniref:hypothetical protein n=1 Tax=Serratia marcescens TaxID=615 RepID=UPI001C3778BF